MTTRQILVFTLTFLAAALTAAALILLLRRPRQQPVPIAASRPVVGPEPAPTSSAKRTSADEPPTSDKSGERGHSWWGVR